jgi:hypothetical protein
VTARFEDGYRIDLDAFRGRLSARTRLVMFASPQNPSGVSITRDVRTIGRPPVLRAAGRTTDGGRARTVVR